jgi:hypothetical protein
MAAKKQLLTQSQYDELARSAEWRIIELPLDVLRTTPGVQRTADLLGVYGSGDASAMKTLNGQLAIFGMDVFVYEHRPKTWRGEWNVNVYHYVVTRTGRRPALLPSRTVYQRGTTDSLADGSRFVTL